MVKTILITVGTGFIGKALVQKLLKETDAHLYIVDNLSASSTSVHYTNNPRITFEQADLSNWKLPRGIKFEQIYHLAGPVGPVRILDFSG